jgi:hypothetical protein
MSLVQPHWGFGLLEKAVPQLQYYNCGTASNNQFLAKLAVDFMPPVFRKVALWKRYGYISGKK